MAKSFIELVKGNEPIFFINALCGLGDVISHLTRLPAVEDKYPDHTICFLLGGFSGSPRLMKEMIERQGYFASIIKNYSFHSQHESMELFIQKSYVNESRGDKYESWSFCREIFANEKPPFLEYEMAFPYTYNTSTKTTDIERFDDFVKCCSIIIKPFTTDGNAEGFQHDIDNNRFWTSEKWVDLIELIDASGYTPVFVGLENDLQDVPSLCTEKGLSFIDYSGLSIEDTILLINNANGCITTNSWEWGIAARAGIPTICNYLKNQFFLPVHLPQGPSKLWNNLYVETNFTNTELASVPDLTVDPTLKENRRDIIKGENTAQDIFDIFNSILKNEIRPVHSYSIAMITYNDIDCIKRTIENVANYVRDDFVVVDGGSTDGTLDVLKSYSGITLLHKQWQDNFETQKNFALENCNQEWRILIDADEEYEHILWNQLPWYIQTALWNSVDCISVPRINIVDDLTQEMVDRQGWAMSHFNWINYPDYQQRIYRKHCKYAGRTHERIIGSKKSSAMVGQHIVHRKSKDRQMRGIKREEDQYQLQAQVTKERINVKPDKKLIIHYLHHLGIGGTAKVVQLLMKYFPKDDEFHHTVAYKAHGEREREPFFEEHLGKDNLICFASGPELFYIVRALNPYIMHRQTGGGPEFPFASPMDQLVDHLITTSIFGNVDETIKLSKQVYISNHMHHCAGAFGEPNTCIGIPVESPQSSENLRQELEIPEDAFVFGRVGRDDNDINDPVNLEAFNMVATDDTYFIALSPSDDLKTKANELGVKNVRWVDKTLDDVRLSKFYNTMDVLAHARSDGECNPGNIWEAFAHGKPCVSHYGIPYNGHIEEIGNAGFVTNRLSNFHNVWQNGNPSSIVDMLNYARSIGLDNFTCEDSTGAIKNDTIEYARIMKAFIDKTIDYDQLSKNAKDRWYRRARPEVIVQQHLDMYRSLSDLSRQVA